ncbi:hypothetical protein [Silvibacterium dinghuense]|uniref:Uncharacterized protein n=1 Tax=Silvibacterium dinghuense TaxID=1560006 RepID=A0A4Q1SI37_9BACT|nr:hypothetical protein [Silvibacterium dinghuense]RXS97065.1 hypothetical protein ESZ00_03815 [Silvibacterium dinghuense]GGG95887.1 hypothetical protein GCM10011586_08740 [Silvibacterium dinghuense]
MIRFAAFCLALFLPLSLAADAALEPIPAERAADTYAIYSLLLPGEPFRSLPPDQVKQWAIADTTVSIDDMNPAIPPDGQLKAPPDSPRGFNEALSDYQRRRHQRFQLTRQFQLSHDYALFTASQVADYRNLRTHPAMGSDFASKYQGIPGITFVSQVFFDSTQSAGLVYVHNWCTNLCAAGQWVYVEKQNGTWVRRSGITSKLS